MWEMQTFLTSALYGRECSASDLGCFSPRENPVAASHSRLDELSASVDVVTKGKTPRAAETPNSAYHISD
jgi:hypothetical protein